MNVIKKAYQYYSSTKQKSMAGDLDDLPHQDTDMTEAALDHDVHVANAGGLEVNTDGHHFNGSSGGPIVPSSAVDEGQQEATQDTSMMDTPSDRLDGEITVEALPSSSEREVESQSEQSNCMPLSSPSDTSTLSPLHCYIRQHCVEYFTATNVHTSPNGGSPRGVRQSTIKEGRVGLRCVFCKNSNDKATQSTSFPSSIDQIPTSVNMWLTRHKDSCRSIPSDVKQNLTQLGQKHNGKKQGNSKATWIESAKDKGLIDTADGIMFANGAAVVTQIADTVEHEQKNEVVVLDEENESDEGDQSTMRRRTRRSSRKEEKESEEMDVLDNSVRGKQGQVNENTWECCGETYSSERKRCKFCKKWNKGKMISESALPENESLSLPPGIELTTPKKNHCKVLNCEKREQSGNKGFCRNHYNMIVLKKYNQASTPRGKSPKLGGSKEEVIELEDEEQKPLRGVRPRCSVPGCDKYIQSKCKDMCFRHHRHSLKKYDSVERAVRKYVSPRKLMSPSEKRNDSTPRGARVSVDQNVSRSGRTLNPARRYGDDDDDDASKSSIEVIPPKTKGTKRTRVEQLEEVGSSKKKKHSPSSLCVFEGCGKFKQTGCGGYCCSHSSAMKSMKLQQYKDGCLDRKNGTDESIVEEKNHTIVSSTKLDGQLNHKMTSFESPKKTKLIETNSSLPSESPAKTNIKNPESKAPSFAKQRKSLAGNENMIKEGDMVKVDDGLLARVLKVNSSNDSKIVTYNIMKILGGREEMVDGTRLSVYRFGSLIQCHQDTNSSKGHDQPFKNTHAMLEMTRHYLLSGQDCWICTTCSVIVPSLTTRCGVCNMFISFVPLEMKEFERFVRGQRKKQNHCWLRKKDINKEDECSTISMAHLCKFQGCVQPSQISYDGYCEFHYNSVSIVKEEDREMTNDYIYHLYEQMEPIVLTEEDLLSSKNKGKEIGEVGLACKHCKGRRSFPNGGKYFL